VLRSCSIETDPALSLADFKKEADSKLEQAHNVNMLMDLLFTNPFDLKA
jgi:hypothetical protein